MYDQTPAGSLSSLVKLEEGLKTYGLLKSIRGSPDMWRPVFVPGCAPTVQPKNNARARSGARTRKRSTEVKLRFICKNIQNARR